MRISDLRYKISNLMVNDEKIDILTERILPEVKEKNPFEVSI